MSDQQLCIPLVEEATTSLTTVEIGASENSCAIQSELSKPDLYPATTASTTPHNFARTSTSRASHRVNIIIAIGSLLLLVLNVIIIAMCLSVLLQEEECEPGKERREVVAPLCVPCQEAMGEGEAGGWRKYPQGEEGSGAQDLCCPLDHQRLAEAVEEIYHTVRNEKMQAFLDNPPEPYKFLFSFEKPQNTDERVMYANHNKPSAHMTAQEPFDVSKCRRPDMGTNDTPTLMETVCDWPLRYEPYRSSTRGFVQRLTWGLVVPTTGWYRIHSAVNFYFPFSQSTVENSQRDKIIPVVHQISRYSIANSHTTALTDHNQTVSHQHSDGLTSFLVTLAHLDVGDVIAISVSHRSAMAIRDRWHTEGLFLMK